MLTLFCPAKLNLFLHITGRRDDGYHNIQTIFQLLDYGDELTIRSRDDGNIRVTPELTGVKPEDHLVIKAAHYLQNVSGTSMGADLRLLKRLPIGGGLGGGSSNAATALVGLNHLWKTGLSTDELANIGVTLGADVPVFVRGCSAWAEGIGENLKALDLPESWYLIVKPRCTVSTAEVFSHEQLTRDTVAITVAAFFEQGGHNDCESVVSSCYPGVAQALDWLRQFSSAQLTGTGACVFATLPSKADALALLDKTPSQWECFVAKGINHSPLKPLLRD
jgi:4-diphosphocytidyl-2-C-methyl-D-erythritol kinase